MSKIYIQTWLIFLFWVHIYVYVYVCKYVIGVDLFALSLFCSFVLPCHAMKLLNVVAIGRTFLKSESLPLFICWCAWCAKLHNKTYGPISIVTNLWLYWTLSLHTCLWPAPLPLPFSVWEMPCVCWKLPGESHRTVDWLSLHQLPCKLS